MIPKTATVAIQVTIVCDDEHNFEQDVFEIVRAMIERGGGEDIDAEVLNVIEVHDA